MTEPQLPQDVRYRFREFPMDYYAVNSPKIFEPQYPRRPLLPPPARLNHPDPLSLAPTMSPSRFNNTPVDTVVPVPLAPFNPSQRQPQVQLPPLDQCGDASAMAGRSSGPAAEDRAREAEMPDPAANRPPTATSTAEIDSTIQRPGSVTINVKGAFIVDQESAEPARSRGSPDHNHSRDIRLPFHTAVVSHIAVDIGGSLIKLVYFSREAHSREPGGRLNFIIFETDHIDECLDFMCHLKEKQQTLNGSKPGELCVMATGGGAYKYYDKIRDVLGVDVLREDEMECLIIGLDFFITEIPREVFTYSETEPMHFATPTDDIYPYLLVNIGSGVSMLKVSGPRQYQRVGGTSLGGGTLWGLLSLLTGARTFDEMLDLASRGDNTAVDMLVGDIYGTDYNKIGLKSTTIASSFGKVFRMKKEAEHEAAEAAAASAASDGDIIIKDEQPDSPVSSFTATADDQEMNQHEQAQHVQQPETEQQKQRQTQSRHARQPSASAASGGHFTSADVSRSLLYAISNNIGQIAYLQSQIHGLSHIYFGGSFIRGHPQTMNTLSYAIRFWSKGKSQAYFLRHEGYLGAVGAFLKRQPRNWGRRGSFEGSSSVPPAVFPR